MFCISVLFETSYLQDLKCSTHWYSHGIDSWKYVEI